MEEPEITVEPFLHKAPVEPRWRDRGFPVTFILSAALLLALIAYIPETYLNLWRDSIMLLTKSIGELSGLTVVNSGEIMTVNGFAMRIIMHCTAIHYIVIITCAVMLSSWHPVWYRLTGVAIAVPVLILFNSIRLLLTGLAGNVSAAAFHFVHDYLWVTLFILLTFGIWIGWDKALRQEQMAISRPVLRVVVLCTLFQAVAWLLSDQIGTVVTSLSSSLLALVPHTPDTVITWKEGKILFSTGTAAFSGSFDTELLMLTVYAGLVTADLISNGTRRWRGGLCGGIILMFVCSAIIAGCAPVNITWGKEAAVLYLWVCQGIMLALPFGIWSIGKRWGR